MNLINVIFADRYLQSDSNFHFSNEFSTEFIRRVIRGCRNKKNLDSLIFLIVSNIYNATKAIVQVIPCAFSNSMPQK